MPPLVSNPLSFAPIPSENESSSTFDNLSAQSLKVCKVALGTISCLQALKITPINPFVPLIAVAATAATGLVRHLTSEQSYPRCHFFAKAFNQHFANAGQVAHVASTVAMLALGVSLSPIAVAAALLSSIDLSRRITLSFSPLQTITTNINAGTHTPIIDNRDAGIQALASSSSTSAQTSELSARKRTDSNTPLDKEEIEQGPPLGDIRYLNSEFEDSEFEDSEFKVISAFSPKLAQEWAVDSSRHYREYMTMMDDLCFNQQAHTEETFPFAVPELLAKKVAYSQSKVIAQGMGIQIPVFNENREHRLVDYKLENLNYDFGLFATYFTPVSEPNEPSYLIFRGTKNRWSMVRDLDRDGVGKTDFSNNADRLYEMVKGSQKINIIGHSLGAADAQRALALLVHKHAEDPSTPREFNLHAFCSPKLDIATVEEWKIDIQKLNEENTSISMNFAQHSSDVVTFAGDSNLVRPSFTPWMQQKYLIVSSPGDHGWSEVAAVRSRHHRTAFFQKGSFDHNVDNRGYAIFDANTNEENLRMAEQKTFGRDEDVGSGWIHLSESGIAALSQPLQELEECKINIEKAEKGLSHLSNTGYVLSKVGKIAKFITLDALKQIVKYS